MSAALISALRRRMLSHGFSVDMMKTEGMVAAVSVVVQARDAGGRILVGHEGSATDLVAAALAILSSATDNATVPALDEAARAEVDGARCLLNNILHGSVR